MSNQEKWTIAKEFSFCYGHRVWSQELLKEFSLDDRPTCRFLHGHEGKVIVRLSGRQLERGMVTDFRHLSWFNQFLQDFRI